MKFKDLSIGEYTLKVSEKSSTPGGGSVLALTNELASSLLLMVCNFTINKKNYEQYQEETRFWDLAPQNLGLKNIFDKLLI